MQIITNWYLIEKEELDAAMEEESSTHHDATFDEELAKAESNGKARLDAVRAMKESSMRLET